MAGSVAGILGYLTKLQCYFQCCFFKGQLAIAICISLKLVLSIQNIFSAVVKDSNIYSELIVRSS